MKRFIILLFVLIIIGVSGYVIYREGSLAVNKTDTATKMFVIRPGEDPNTITNNLAKEGLIRNKLVFYMIIKQMGIEKKIQAGDFALSPSMDARTLADTLTHGSVDLWLTLIEGWRKEEVAEAAAKKFDITEADFNKLADEGYLFPDSYLIPKGATSERIIQILTDTFEQKYSNEMKQKARTLNLTDDEVVILASMLERETQTPEDKQKVASIILKRLRNDWPLQIDATVQYVLGYQPAEKRWWKKELTFEDLKIESPYNTYTNKGLPPDPIANPGLASLTAVVNADESTPYWYYISGPDGTMYYSETLDEHNALVEKYINN